MLNKKTLLGVSCLLSLGAAQAAPVTIASVTTGTGLFTTQPTVCTVDFNTIASLTACPGVTYSAPNGIATHLVNGSVGGQYAAPTNTQYLTVGPSQGQTVTINLGVAANYFGFYAGSIDSYNGITFTNASNESLSLTGTQINAYLTSAVANGSQSAYFNFFTNGLFNTVTLTSSQNAFETDNHSFGIAVVPEPAPLALLGLGALGLVVARRRRTK